MIKDWTCLYCGTINPLNTRFCTSCNASLLDISRQFYKTQQDKPFSVINKPKVTTPTPPKTSAEEEIDEESEVPKKGELVEGLFEISQGVLSGAISPEEFQVTIEEVSSNLNEVFEEIYSELGNIEEEEDDDDDDDEEANEIVSDYTSLIMDMLQSVHFMFELSLEEMVRYNEDKDPIHIFNGQRLAQKAEMDYIEVSKMLQADAAMNPFAGETDVLSDLASRVAEGTMTVESFNENLEDLRKFQEEMIEEANILLDEGYEMASAFDGNEEGVIFGAREKFKIAADKYSQVILNLYSPEDTREAVRDLVEEVVDDMD